MPKREYHPGTQGEFLQTTTGGTGRGEPRPTSLRKKFTHPETVTAREESRCGKAQRTLISLVAGGGEKSKGEDLRKRNSTQILPIANFPQGYGHSGHQAAKDSA